MARPASDISQRVLHAARERFLLDGVDGASLRKIAQDANTNIGMIYYYFKTKDELFHAVVEEVYATFVRDLTVALADDVPADQRLRRVYRRVARVNDVEFQVLRLILREALVSSTRFSRLAERFQAGHIPLMLNTLREGVQNETFRNDRHPLALMGATFSLAIMPQILLRLVEGSTLPIAHSLPPREVAADELCNVLLHGIGGTALGK